MSFNKNTGNNNESLGMLLYNERNRQNVGRAELCAGLMSEGNLCRIETAEGNRIHLHSQDLLTDSAWYLRMKGHIFSITITENGKEDGK